MTTPATFTADQMRVVEIQQKGPGPERVYKEMAFDDLGTLEVETLDTPCFSFSRAGFDLKRNVLLQVPHTGKKEKFVLTIMSAGEVCAIFSEKEEVKVSGGLGSFKFDPAVTEEHRLYGNRPTRTTAFDIPADYLTQLIFEQDEAERGQLTLLKENILRGEFINFPFSATPAHQRIVSDIDHCPLQGSLGNLMLEGSLQQLIALQLSLLCTPKTAREYIHARDREILHAIREYLTANFHGNLSILSLSRQFGINQTKLKKYFKMLFGVPVIEYVFNLKMEHARFLLYDQGMYVGEVARITGYKNPNHFATAFKRRFGINPSGIKKS